LGEAKQNSDLAKNKVVLWIPPYSAPLLELFGHAILIE